MKLTLKNTFLFTAIASSVVLTACSDKEQVKPAAAEQEKPAQVESQKAVEQVPAVQAAESAVTKYNGTIEGEKFDTYHFKGEKGQKVVINVTGQGHAEAVLYGYDDFMQNEPYTLPESGDYEVRVVQPRTFARDGAKSTYELTIEIK
ncbi:hypothetical protein KRX11_07380 [Pasteurellaceae bacterium TAE3-ERU1]|uniref:hypothetical protein n=1 Tax=Spirabiliibacterium mucosae TaxID=28156 RepID=UPI001AAD6D79|nr:hypothetical protein [Spirabiliibacterium mucosae]MBE2898840.1 hypothetical protein [Spirabiliibacterium mucosae]MBV7388462.1 hypothetical protein [Pasteurellaceae bacterium TAE3-ERU1]